MPLTRGEVLAWAGEPERRRRALAHLRALSRAVTTTGDLAVDQVFAQVEAEMSESSLTPDQLERARRRHGGMAGWLTEGAALVADVTVHIGQGTEPSAPGAQELARRWDALMADMTGGDDGLRSGMYAKIESKGAAAATKGILTDEAWDFLKRAFVVGYRAPS